MAGYEEDGEFDMAAFLMSSNPSIRASDFGDAESDTASVASDRASETSSMMSKALDEELYEDPEYEIIARSTLKTLVRKLYQRQKRVVDQQLSFSDYYQVLDNHFDELLDIEGNSFDPSVIPRDIQGDEPISLEGCVGHTAKILRQEQDKRLAREMRPSASIISPSSSVTAQPEPRVPPQATATGTVSGTSTSDVLGTTTGGSAETRLTIEVTTLEYLKWKFFRAAPRRRDKETTSKTTGSSHSSRYGHLPKQRHYHWAGLSPKERYIVTCTLIALVFFLVLMVSIGLQIQETLPHRHVQPFVFAGKTIHALAETLQKAASDQHLKIAHGLAISVANLLDREGKLEETLELTPRLLDSVQVEAISQKRHLQQFRRQRKSQLLVTASTLQAAGYVKVLSSIEERALNWTAPLDSDINSSVVFASGDAPLFTPTRRLASIYRLDQDKFEASYANGTQLDFNSGLSIGNLASTGLLIGGTSVCDNKTVLRKLLQNLPPRKTFCDRTWRKVSIPVSGGSASEVVTQEVLYCVGFVVGHTGIVETNPRRYGLCMAMTDELEVLRHEFVRHHRALSEGRTQGSPRDNRTTSRTLAQLFEYDSLFVLPGNVSIAGENSGTSQQSSNTTLALRSLAQVPRGAISERVTGILMTSPGVPLASQPFSSVFCIEDLPTNESVSVSEPRRKVPVMSHDPSPLNPWIPVGQECPPTEDIPPHISPSPRLYLSLRVNKTNYLEKIVLPLFIESLVANETSLRLSKLRIVLTKRVSASEVHMFDVKGSTTKQISVDFRYYPHYAYAAWGRSGRVFAPSPFEMNAAVGYHHAKSVGIGVVVEHWEPLMSVEAVAFLCRGVDRIRAEGKHMEGTSAFLYRHHAEGQLRSLCPTRGVSLGPDELAFIGATLSWRTGASSLPYIDRYTGEKKMAYSVYSQELQAAILVTRVITACPFVNQWWGHWFLIALGLLILYFVGLWLVFLVSFDTIEAEHLVYKRSIHDEKARFFELVEDILPNYLAGRLESQEGGLLAEKHRQLTFVFTDLSGTSELFSSLPIKLFIRSLGYLFLLEDSVARYYNLFKVKTVGDAYFAVAGLPSEEDPEKTHSMQVVRAFSYAAVVQQLMNPKQYVHYPERTEAFRAYSGESFNEVPLQPLLVKIGVHCGPTFVSIPQLGRAPQFDCFGPTVSLAKQLEQFAPKGHVLTSYATKRILQATDPDRLFVFAKTQKKLLKNLGAVATCSLLETTVSVPQELIRLLHVHVLLQDVHHDMFGTSAGRKGLRKEREQQREEVDDLVDDVEKPELSTSSSGKQSDVSAAFARPAALSPQLSKPEGPLYPIEILPVSQLQAREGSMGTSSGGSAGFVSPAFGTSATTPTYPQRSFQAFAAAAAEAPDRSLSPTATDLIPPALQQPTRIEVIVDVPRATRAPGIPHRASEAEASLAEKPIPTSPGEVLVVEEDRTPRSGVSSTEEILPLSGSSTPTMPQTEGYPTVAGDPATVASHSTPSGRASVATSGDLPTPEQHPIPPVPVPDEEGPHSITFSDQAFSPTSGVGMLSPAQSFPVVSGDFLPPPPPPPPPTF